VLGRTYTRFPAGTTPVMQAVAALAGMAGEQALGGGGSRAGGEPDLRRARELLGGAYSDAWCVALDLAHRYAWVIAAVARQLIERRELDEDEFVALVGKR
jgi:hypothetical protein